MSNPQVRTRMAPSPTGEYHVGHIATLLKNYAFAKQHNGSFILRIEDTDRARLVPGAVEKILSVITAYGLDWDEGPVKGGPYAPYVQSERLELYKKYAVQLVESNDAYYCTCSSDRLARVREEQQTQKIPPKYDRHCFTNQSEIKKQIAEGVAYVIRLRVPDNETVSFDDMIRGTIETPSSSVDDQVLLKSDGFPTYHLAVVIDDHEMKITHVFRGEEWISSTPKHILLYKAFGWQPPVYGHIPVFLNPDGKGKMSKRKGTVSAESFLNAGYLPEALLNFFMILGWTPKDQREILTLHEYIQEFNPASISPKSVVFDVKKLDWLNGVYIRSLPQAELIQKLNPFLPKDFPKNNLEAILPLVVDRLVTLKDIEEHTEFFYRPITVDTTILLKRSSAAEVANQLQKTNSVLSKIDNWNLTSIENAVRALQATENWDKRQYFMMLRIAITGKTATPPLFETIVVLGKEKLLSRLQIQYSQLL
ncbi:MAG: glutamate--tRNA ligase [Microgenomates group bacterium]